MNEKEIKESWRRSSEKLVTDNDGRQYDNKRNTSLARLAERYNRFSRLALIFAFLGPMWLYKIEAEEIYRIIIFVWYSGTMVVASLIDRYLYKRVSEIDICEMTPPEVLEKGMECRKIHLKSICFLIPLALGLIVFISWLTMSETYFFWGVVTGAVLGIAVGLFQLMEFMHDYRGLMKS